MTKPDGQPIATETEFDSIEIEPEHLASKLEQSGEVVIIDVREPQEFEHSHIANARHIPLGILADNISDISPDTEVVVYCRSGGRGWKAANILRNAGVGKTQNLKGGLTAWVNRVDPSLSVFR